VEIVLEVAVLVEVGKSNVLFRKGMMDSEPDLFRYDSVKKLADYVDDKDAEIEKVKILIRKANRDLKRLRDKQLYIRKASSRDKDAENRICITSR